MMETKIENNPENIIYKKGLIIAGPCSAES